MKINAALLAVALGVGSSPALAQMMRDDLIPPYRVDMLIRSAGLSPTAATTVMPSAS